MFRVRGKNWTEVLREKDLAHAAPANRLDQALLRDHPASPSSACDDRIGGVVHHGPGRRPGAQKAIGAGVGEKQGVDLSPQRAALTATGVEHEGSGGLVESGNLVEQGFDFGQLFRRKHDVWDAGSCNRRRPPTGAAAP